MLHFWWIVKVPVFWTLVEPLRLVALRVQRPCSPRVLVHDIRIPEVWIPLVVDHSIL